MHMILDKEESIVFHREDEAIMNGHVFAQNLHGLNFIDRTVRHAELEFAKQHRGVVFTMGIPAVVGSFFGWFCMTLMNHLRLVKLLQLMKANGWSTIDLQTNRAMISSECTGYARSVAPEIAAWRNKVFAHYAMTMPYDNDSIELLNQSVWTYLTYRSTRFELGRSAPSFGTDALPSWSIIMEYERLAPRLWSDLSADYFRHDERKPLSLWGI